MMDEIKQEVGQFTRICIPLVKKIYTNFLITDRVIPVDYDIALRRKLKAVWTMEAEQDLNAWRSTNESTIRQIFDDGGFRGNEVIIQEE